MFIDSRHKLFSHLDRLAQWQNGDRPAPVTIEWDLSNRCVLGCQDCHFAHTHTRGPWVNMPRVLPMAYDNAGDLADPALVMRGLREAAAAGVQGVVWSGGGEPTTHPDWLGIVNRAHSLGLQQGMYTLGGLLTPITARALAKAATWVVVSLDAANAFDYYKEKGSNRFDAACSGITFLALSQSAVVGVSFLLHSENWRQAGSMLNLARRLGATYSTFRPAIRFDPHRQSVCPDDRSWIDLALPLLRELAGKPDVELDSARFSQYRDWSTRSYSTCYGIRLTTTITPDGRVWVCPQRRGFQDSCLGDLRTESFASVWARHPGRWTDFDQCRIMCRLHLMNETLAQVFDPHLHEAFM